MRPSSTLTLLRHAILSVDCNQKGTAGVHNNNFDCNELQLRTLRCYCYETI